MNKVSICGRLTKELVMRDSGTNVVKFTLAVSRFKKTDGADFVPVVAFGKTAQLVEKYLEKGCRVIVIGRYHTDSYEKEGKKVYTTSVLADNVEIIDFKKKGEEGIPEGFQTFDDDDEIPF